MIYSATNIKYLDIKTFENLTLQHHANDISAKLNRGDALLLKIKKFVDDATILRSIYFAISENNLNCCCFVWTQNSSVINYFAIS